MVATLLKLRFLILKNTLKRHPWQLVGVIFGGLYGLGILALAVSMLLFLGFQDRALVSSGIVLVGSVLVLGWSFAPLFSSGMDRTLDPQRFVTFPIRTETLMFGIALSTALGIPGIVTSLFIFATTLAWLSAPVAAVAAFVLTPVALFTCVLGAQVVTTLAARLSANRRVREVAAFALLVPLMLLGPILFSIGEGVATFGEALPGVAAALSWTPLGAVWGVPVALAEGQWLGALLRLLIALATVAALAWAWRPLFIAGQGALLQGSRAKSHAGTGLFRFFPATPMGAIAARCLTGWFRDPRYGAGLIIVPLMPVVFGFSSSMTDSTFMFLASVPFVAALIALSTMSDLSYDGTAFSTHLVHGVRGVWDRGGRVWANAIVAVPLIAVILVAVTAIADAWAGMPALAGLTAMLLFGGLGVSSVCSALLVMPVPGPGDSPFVSKPGAGALSMAGFFGCFGALFIVSIPVSALMIVSGITGVAAWGWAALGAGLVLGPAAMLGGIVWGGRILDRRGPEMLVRLQAQQ